MNDGTIEEVRIELILINFRHLGSHDGETYGYSAWVVGGGDGFSQPRTCPRHDAKTQSPGLTRYERQQNRILENWFADNHSDLSIEIR